MTKIDLTTIQGCCLKNKQQLEELQANPEYKHRFDHLKVWDMQQIDIFRNQAIIDSMSEDRTIQWLDMGCAYSEILHWLAEHNFQGVLSGTDLRNEVLKAQFVNAPNIVAGDICKTEFASNSFDYISCLSVIEHKVPLANFVKEVSRLLKSNGWLLLTFDYWPEKPREECLNKSDVFELVALARQHGMINNPFNLDVEDKMVYDMFTFGSLFFQKA